MLNFFYTTDSKHRLIQNSVFEFCDKTLEKIIQKIEAEKTYLPISEIKRYIKETLNGLANMHALKIVHRDLKPENILIKGQTVKICDFGSSIVLDV